jgi:hypothetical protein
VADLIFSFQDVLDEIQQMSLIAEDYLTDESQQIVLPNYSRLLEGIRAQRPRTPTRWVIPEGRPLRTIDSSGEYEPGQRRGPHTVFAELTAVWSVLCPEEHGPRRQPQKNFVLSGIASIKVRVMERLEEGTRELAMWRVEIGDNASPGCHFHSQIEGERTDPPFPHSLSVPRLPSILVSAMAVLEFVLAEMFQSGWQRHAAAESAEMLRWKTIQKRRLLNLFRWQSQCIERAIGSPWTAFKLRKPDSDLFVRDR